MNINKIMSFVAILLLASSKITQTQHQHDQQITSDNQNIVINHPGADYVKVHFAKFNIPTGSHVLVSNNKGELYKYDGKDHSLATFDQTKGEDGYTSFSSMSIFGSKVEINLILPQGIKWDQDKHIVKIQQYNAGTMDSDELDGNTSNAEEGKRFLTQESICGADDKINVECLKQNDKTKYNRSKAVAVLVQNGTFKFCTAWRVGESNRMFTNNHCIDSVNDVQDTEVWFNYQYDACNGGALETVTKVRGDSMLATKSQYDFTLFSVTNFADISKFGYLGLEVSAPVTGDNIYIAQHPSGAPKKFHDCPLEGSNSQQAKYNCDTYYGSSGSPVILESSNKVIALHNQGGCFRPNDTNKGVRIDIIWPFVSQYFNNQIPETSEDGYEYLFSQGRESCTSACQRNGQTCSAEGLKTINIAWSTCRTMINKLGFFPNKGGQYRDNNAGCTYHPGQSGWFQVMRKNGDPECDAIDNDRSRQRVCACE